MSIQALLFHLLLTTRLPATPQPSEPPPARITQFLEYLKNIAPSHPGPGNQYRLPKPIDTTVFLGYVSSTGVFFSDVEDEVAPGQVGRARLSKELKSGRGLIYRYVVGLTIAASEIRNGSPIHFETKDGVTRVFLIDHVLTFVPEDGLPKLQRLENTDPGGD
jgi:hypothetical protein